MDANKTRPGSVQFADPESPSGVEVSAKDFLKECRASSMARFRQADPGWVGCRSIEHPVPPLADSDESTGMIVAHVSPAVCRAWEANAHGTDRQKRSHVDAQVHLALEDLAAQDMHGYLALTDAQCDLFGPDLVQLTCESLDRTTFSRLGRRPDPRWEGTLVERVRPPYLVLAVSIDFESKAAPKGAKAKATPKRPTSKAPRRAKSSRAA